MQRKCPHRLGDPQPPPPPRRSGGCTEISACPAPPVPCPNGHGCRIGRPRNRRKITRTALAKTAPLHPTREARSVRPKIAIHFRQIFAWKSPPPKPDRASMGSAGCARPLFLGTDTAECRSPGLHASAKRLSSVSGPRGPDPTALREDGSCHSGDVKARGGPQAMPRACL